MRPAVGRPAAPFPRRSTAATAGVATQRARLLSGSLAAVRVAFQPEDHLRRRRSSFRSRRPERGSRCIASVAGELLDLGNDSIDRYAIGVDLDSVRGGPQRRRLPATVNRISLPGLLEHRLETLDATALATLPKTTSCPLFRGRIQIDLETGVWNDDSTDIAAHHDHLATRRNRSLQR